MTNDMEITDWLRRLADWAGDATAKENVRHVITRAETEWNRTHDNTETAVVKHLSADDLRAQAVGDWTASLDAFLTAQEA